MNKLMEWYGKYQTHLTWWVIGWLSFAVIDCSVRGDLILSLVNAILIYINYIIWKRNQ